MKYFTFYGFNESTQKIEKIPRGNTVAEFIGQNKQKEDINLYDEAKKLVMESKHIIYFDTQKFKSKQYGFASINDKVTTKDAKCKDMKKFTFGYEMDIDKARNIFETIEKEDSIPSQENSPEQAIESKDAKYDAKTFQIADEYLKCKRELDEIKGNINPALDMFKKEFEDGEVITDGNEYYAIVIGILPGAPIADAKKLEADGLKSKYSKLSKAPVSLTVSDGITPEKSNVKMLVKSGLSAQELVSYADAVYVQTPIIAEKEKQLERLKNMLLQLCPEGSTAFKSVNKELVVNISKGKPREIINTDKLKADGLFDKYCKTKADSRYMSVRKI